MSDYAQRLELARQAWRSDLGADRFLERGVPDADADGAIGIGMAPDILRPRTVDEVCAALAIAGEHAVPLHPRDAVQDRGDPPHDRPQPADASGAVLLDLSALNRIRRVDARHGVAWIDSGVSQGALADHLAIHAPGWLINPSRAARASPLVGHALEGGLGCFGARADDLLGLEVVLPGGEAIRVGAGWDEPVELFGASGPRLTGLFVQSSLGIVTGACVRLYRRRAEHAALTIALAEQGDLAALLDALIELRGRDCWSAVLELCNRPQTVDSLLGGYRDYLRRFGGPAGRVDAEDARARLDARVPAWSGSVALAGSRHHLNHVRGLVARRLHGLARVGLASSDRFDREFPLLHATRALRWARERAAHLMALRPTLALAAGRPGNAIDDSPRDHTGEHITGVLQCSPWLPLDGQQAVRVLDELRDVFHGHALDDRISLKLVSGRELVATVSAPFDRRDRDAARRARACMDDALDLARRHGLRMQQAPDHQPDQRTMAGPLLATVKQALDPHGSIESGCSLP